MSLQSIMNEDPGGLIIFFNLAKLATKIALMYKITFVLNKDPLWVPVDFFMLMPTFMATNNKHGSLILTKGHYYFNKYKNKKRLS